MDSQRRSECVRGGACTCGKVMGEEETKTERKGEDAVDNCMRRPEIFGVMFDNITLEAAAEKAADMVHGSFYHYIVGTNANLLRMARKDAAYRGAVNQADLSLADGCGVLYASRILKTSLTERVPCMDLLEALLSKLHGVRVYILGGKSGTAEQAGENLRVRYPQLELCGTHHGYFEDAKAMAEEIAKSQPDLLLVCLGSPKQELWMKNYGRLTGAKLAFGCGGWIDIAAGRLKRAPESWRKHDLEWVWRFLQEPWRFGRVCRSLTLPLLAVKEAVEVRFFHFSQMGRGSVQKQTESQRRAKRNRYPSRT